MDIEEDTNIKQAEESKGESQQAQEVSFVDMLNGGEAPHSQEAGVNNGADFGFNDVPQDEGAKASESKDSNADEQPKAEPVTYSEEDYNALKDNLERTRKRLHDTQSRLHEVCTERSSLRKELDSLAEKNDGDWFSEEDTEKKESLEKRLRESDDTLRELDEQSETSAQDAAYESWEAATRPVRKAHPDFDKMVYEYLYGKIAPDSKDYDPAVRAMWDKAPKESKSPTGIYDFAVKLKEKMEYLDDPDAYKKRIREEIEKETRSVNTSPVGEEGLDLVNGSAPSNGNSQQSDTNFVEALFK